jgi:hypothetical protein
MLRPRSLRFVTALRTHLFLYRYSLRSRALRLSMAAGHGMLACCYLPHIRAATGASNWVVGGLTVTTRRRSKCRQRQEATMPIALPLSAFDSRHAEDLDRSPSRCTAHTTYCSGLLMR